MATIPTFQVWVAGTIVTAAQLAANIQQPGQFWMAKPYCVVSNSTGQSCATATNVLVAFDNEPEDNDGMHSTVTNTSRITCVTPGVFTFLLASGWSTNATGGRLIDLRLNSGGSGTGGTDIRVSSAAASPLASNWQIHLPIRYRFVNIGDYVEMFVQQTSGSTISTGAGYSSLSTLWEIA